MNIPQLKALSWVAALAAGGALGWYVYDFIQTREMIRVAPNDRIRELLDNIKEPEAKQVRLVEYKQLLRGMKELNWTGVLPPEPKKKEEVAPTAPTKPPVVPVKDVLRILYVQVDTLLPSRSLAFVTYKDTKLGDTGTLRVGDKLPGKFEHVHVVSIAPAEVVFGFDDEAREHETLGPMEFDMHSTIVTVGPGGALLPNVYAIQKASPDFVRSTWNEDTLMVRQNEYRVGTRDVEQFSESWSEMLANDVRYKRWRNPSTGRYEGIYISDIKNGSLASKFGIQSGDVIKSVNGHAVSSSQEAISYVKQEVKDKVIEKWYVVVESLGKERTVVIDTPH